MALQKTKVPLPLASGIDTKTDPNQRPIGTLEVLENVIFDTPNSARKRNGYSAISIEDNDKTEISNIKKLEKFNKELCMFSSSQMYSYIESLEQWSPKGSARTVIPESQQILRNEKEQSELDCVHTEDLNFFVYKDSEGIHLSITDNQTGNFLTKKQTLTATGTKPRIAARNSQVYVVYEESTDLYYRKIDAFDYENIGSPILLTSDYDNTAAQHDMIRADDNIIIAFTSTLSGGSLSFKKIQVDDIISSTTSIAGEIATKSITLFKDINERVICSYVTATDIKVVGYNSSVTVKTIVETSLETNSNVINSLVIQMADGSYTAVYEIDEALDHNHYLKSNTITLQSVIGTPQILKRSVGLASKGFTYDSEGYFLALHKSTLQSTYFLLDLQGNIVSRINPNTGGDLITNGALPSVSSIDSTNYLTTSQIKGRLVEENGTFFSLLGVNQNTLEFDPDLAFETSTLASNLHVAGGLLKAYDGSTLTEHGFHLYPENILEDSTATTGGSISDGTYEYIAVYAWTDAQGQIHRSAASPAISVVLSGATNTQTQTIEIPTLRLTSKEDVIIELYRTEDVGTIFYKVSSTTAPTENDPTVDSVTIVDSTSDTDLINNEILYTTGGVLENLPAPSSSIVESFKNRVFVSSPKAGKLSYSKLQFEGSPVEFNDTLEMTLPARGGNVIALKAMDDKLIIFKENAIYYISGDGPNNLGELDNFIEPELVISDIGCNTGKSVVLTPLGIMFQSKKGIYLLNRSLGLDYIGAPVEEFNELTITSAEVVPAKNQIRFTTFDGKALIYDYYVQKWSTFTNHSGLSAVSINDDYYYLRTDNNIFQEDATFSDNGSVINMKTETSWISFAGVQNYQRVYRMLLLGSFKSAHKLRIKVAYNYTDAYVEEKIINTADFIDTTAYGDSSPYGAEATYGSSNLLQFRLDFSRQKCESIKVSIEDLQSEPGEGLRISNINFVVGAKKGEYKTSESVQYGSKS